MISIQCKSQSHTGLQIIKLLKLLNACVFKLLDVNARTKSNTISLMALHTPCEAMNALMLESILLINPRGICELVNGLHHLVCHFADLAEFVHVLHPQFQTLRKEHQMRVNDISCSRAVCML